MKFKIGDRVRIIKRKAGNRTGGEKWHNPNGDVGSCGVITAIDSDKKTYCVENGIKYFGFFDHEEIELYKGKRGRAATVKTETIKYVVSYEVSDHDHIQHFTDVKALHEWLKKAIGFGDVKSTAFRVFEVKKEFKVLTSFRLKAA